MSQEKQEERNAPRLKVLLEQAAFKRANPKFRDYVYLLFLPFASLARYVIEVFLRKDFGRRYFQLSTARMYFVLLFLWPALHWSIGFQLSMILGFMTLGIFQLPTNLPIGTFLYMYSGWYIYLFFFYRACLQHHKAQKLPQGVFDFDHYSWDAGTIHPRLRNLTFRGKWVSIRTIECWVEPGIFFCLGIASFFFGQFVGWLFILSSAAYAISYRVAYRWGDNFVLDQIDEMTLNQDMKRIFIDDDDWLHVDIEDEGKDGEKDARHGATRFRGNRPNSRTEREKIYKNFVDDEGVPIAH